jgi:hypothetical protein
LEFGFTVFYQLFFDLFSCIESENLDSRVLATIINSVCADCVIKLTDNKQIRAATFCLPKNLA